MSSFLLGPEILITRNTCRDGAAPNISLNRQNSVRIAELYLVAVFGALLQIGVLVYFAFITYYHKLQFKKDGKPVRDYAFPLAFSGTAILGFGMLLCAHIVESSTSETNHIPASKWKAGLTWLQQEKTVSDQVFKSTALHPQRQRSVITTSCRRRVESQDDRRQGFSKIVHEIGAMLGGMLPRCLSNLVVHKPSDELGLNTLTIFSTSISLVGFILQFMGLRGMHWSASVFQLGAVGIMTLLKVIIRRGYADPLISQNLVSKYELDWFVLEMCNIDQPPYMDQVKPQLHQKPTLTNTWSIVSPQPEDDFQPLDESASHNSPVERKHDRDISQERNTAFGVLSIRRDLARLADWRGPAAEQAICLARAMEVTMNMLFPAPNTTNKRYVYNIPVKYNTEARPNITIHLDWGMRGTQKTWMVSADGIEAALSLWMYSTHHNDNKPSQERTFHGDSWLRTKGQQPKLGLRLLGPYSFALLCQLQWWASTDLPEILQVENKGPNEQPSGEDAEDSLEFESYRLIGCGRRNQEQTSASSSSFVVKNTFIGTPDSIGGISTKKESELEADQSKKCHLAVKSFDPLEKLYANDMFSAFMWTVAKSLSGPLEGETEVRWADQWDARELLALRNESISKLALDIHNTGLGSLQDVYFSLLPPLIMRARMACPEAIIDQIQQDAVEYENTRDFGNANRIYSRLLEIGTCFPPASYFRAKVAATVMEYCRSFTQPACQRAFRYIYRKEQEVADWQVRLKQALQQDYGDVLPQLIRLYMDQGRKWGGDLLGNVSLEEALDTKHFPQLERLVKSELRLDPRLRNDSDPPTLVYNPDARRKVPGKSMNPYIRTPVQCAPAGVGRGKVRVDTMDAFNWTPLHYAAAGFSQNHIYELLRMKGVDINSRDLSGYSPLHYACQRGGPKRNDVDNLIHADANVNARGRDGLTPLHLAAMEGHRDVVKKLCRFGVAVDALDAAGATALHWAVWGASKGTDDETTNMLELLIPLNNVMAADNEGRTPLHDAAAWGRAKSAKVLLRAQANPEAIDKLGFTALHCAVEHGQEAIVEILLDEEVDLEAFNNKGKTALHIAAKRNYKAIVKILLDAGANTKAVDNNRKTALHMAADMNHEAIVEILLDDEDFDIEAVDRDNRTALHCAIQRDHCEVLNILLKAKANTGAIDTDGSTALHLAAMYNCKESTQVLLDAKVDINMTDHSGETALHVAIENDHEAIVKVLLNAKANIEARNRNGQTPLHFAIERADWPVIEMLLKAKANIEAVGTDGRTALHVAASNGDEETVQALLKAHANIKAKDSQGKTALGLAIKKGNHATVHLLRTARAQAKANEKMTNAHDHTATPSSNA